ncbi:hypothetical protein VTL71DRAFT_10745 [Oculimacula yallundae]|uniref:GP-PDE domain-containing protein n=1 Tax=Oculimacula yallundae TaxID=86028 RepID=A0ABR4CTZ1_9HELO
MAKPTASETVPLLPEKMDSPNFTSALQTSAGRRPQAIAHRGYKAKYPENSMGAFRGAVEVGAHAIETDVHLSKDGVVVLSHDATLKRCFGLEEKIVDCEWSYLQSLRTVRKPQQPMPRLVDLLEYLTTPGLEDIWILLDIKLDDEPDALLESMAAAINSVKPSRRWAERIILGCWNAKYLPVCNKHLPGFPITHIGWNIPYARQFLEIPGISFNMFQRMMIGPGGQKFMKDVRKAGRSLFLWTVNDDNTMRWSISKGVDGVITDDPKRYLEICRSYNGEKVSMSLKAWTTFVLIKFGVPFYKLLVRYKYGAKMSMGRVKQDLLIGGGRARDHERVEETGKKRSKEMDGKSTTAGGGGWVRTSNGGWSRTTAVENAGTGVGKAGSGSGPGLMTGVEKAPEQRSGGALEAYSGIRIEVVNGREERVDVQGFRERDVPVVQREKGEEKVKEKEKEKKGGLKRIVEGMVFGIGGGGKKGKEKTGLRDVVDLATKKAEEDRVDGVREDGRDSREDDGIFEKDDKRIDEKKEAHTQAALRWAEKEREIKAHMEDKYHIEARSPIRKILRTSATELEKGESGERNTPPRIRPLLRTGTQTSWTSWTEPGQDVEGKRSSAGGSLDLVRGQVDERSASAEGTTTLTIGSRSLPRTNAPHVDGKNRVVKSSRDLEREKFVKELKAADQRLARVRDGRGWIERSL